MGFISEYMIKDRDSLHFNVQYNIKGVIYLLFKD